MTRGHTHRITGVASRTKLLTSRWELAAEDRTERFVDLSQRASVRAGDRDAFDVLFEEHARAVYNHAFRLTGDWSAAEEVVSLTFLEAWRLRSTVRPECERGKRHRAERVRQ